MSQKPIALSPDLARLRAEEYDIEIIEGYLVIRDIPYLNKDRTPRRGVLVLKLVLNADKASRPPDHVAYFAGEYPCHADGSQMNRIVNEQRNQDLVAGKLTINFTFSSRPETADADYYEKVTRYIEVLSAPARHYDSTLTARTSPAIRERDAESPFVYIDTASSRVGIVNAANRLALDQVAIVGTGGTGSYVLDFVAKTRVKKIHLFDKDVFSQHNAFRSPGAATFAELEAKMPKVEYLKSKYSAMHKGIEAHPIEITETNIEQLRGMQFVFFCNGGGTSKSAVVRFLIEAKIPFIDVGMGLFQTDEGKIGGLIKTTTITPTKNDHLAIRVSTGADDGDDAYSSNIQVADLNAINAVLAVIKWKKLFGFYADTENEHNSTYSVDSNSLINEDKP